MSGTRAHLRPPHRPAKAFCVRGHKLADVGFYYNTVKNPSGVVYLTRRCAVCAVIDVQKCRARKRRRAA